MRRRRKSRRNQRYLPMLSVILMIIGVLFIRLESTLSDMLKDVRIEPEVYLAFIGMEIGAVPDSEFLDFGSAFSALFEGDEETEVLDEEITLHQPMAPESAFKPEVDEVPETAPTTETTITSENFIKNHTDYQPDINAMLNTPHEITLPSEGVSVLLVHTHGSEAYTPNEEFNYVQDDNDRTLDRNYNIIRVGNEIEEILTERGIEVLHLENIFDSPTYSGSYTRSLKAIEDAIEEHPTIKVVIDIHRDAIIAADGTKYKPVTDIDGEKAAQLMLVMGSNEGGLTHDDYQTNLNFAVNLQHQITQKYPELMRPIDLREERFNQHMTTGSMILEVGSNGNTMTEALVSARIFADELANILLN